MEQKEYRLAAIMYTDIAGFSRMMEESEAGTLEALRTHNRLISEAVGKHDGRTIKSVGDVSLSEFSNTVDAVRCAVDIQQAVGAYNDTEPPMPLHLRIGIHLGDIYFFDGDALGEGVSIASRLQGLATPGRICISRDVLNLVSARLDLQIRSLGNSRLKNMSREIETYEIAVTAAAEEPGQESETRANLRDDESAGFTELKELVLGEIKKAGRRISIDELRARVPDRSPDLDAALENLADRGFLSRKPHPRRPHPRQPHPRRADPDGGGRDEDEEARIQARWDRILDEAQSPVSSDVPGHDSLVEDYKEHVADAADKERAGFRSHLISYLAVNGGLFLLWSMTTFGGFPWFLIVVMAWGIGLASHFAGVRQKAREHRELDEWPGLTREQLRIYRKLVKARNNWSGHLISNIATSAFLVALNLWFSPGFLWAAFPVGLMAIGVFSHLPAYRSKERRLLKRLKDLGANVAHLMRGRRATHAAEVRPAGGSESPVSREAHAVRERIAAKIASLPASSPVDDGFLPVLDNYVEQITLLDRRSREVDEIVRGIPLADLQRDLASLQKQRSGAADETVRAEYARSIAQIEKQQASFADLRNQREVLRLRLSSGLSQLKQIEIELARMATVSAGEEAASVGMLTDKADELRQYLDDLQEAYRELE